MHLGEELSLLLRPGDYQRPALVLKQPGNASEAFCRVASRLRTCAGVQQDEWLLRVNLRLLQVPERLSPLVAWQCDDQLALSDLKAQVFDQAQIPLRLVNMYRRALKLMREYAAAKFKRFARAQWNAGQVADIGRRVRRLAKRGKDQRGIEMEAFEHANQLLFA